MALKTKISLMRLWSRRQLNESKVDAVDKKYIFFPSVFHHFPRKGAIRIVERVPWLAEFQ